MTITTDTRSIATLIVDAVEFATLHPDPDGSLEQGVRDYLTDLQARQSELIDDEGPIAARGFAFTNTELEVIRQGV